MAVKFDRLKKNHEFKRVYRRGRSMARRCIVMYYLPNGKDYNRIGFSISKKVGNSVVRHRIRRLIFESFRLLEDKIISGYDFIFIARFTASEAKFDEVENDLRCLFQKARLWYNKG